MFIFIYDIMVLYYQKKLIAISNHRFDTYIALRFQGLNANKVGKEDIVSSTSGWYQVRCLTERSKFYDVYIYTLESAHVIMRKMDLLVFIKLLLYRILELKVSILSVPFQLVPGLISPQLH